MFNDIRVYLKNKKWRKLNKHNKTKMANVFDMSKVEVKNYSYGPLFVETFGLESEKLSIGNFCSIAYGVKFLLGGEHDYKKVSTYPFHVHVFHDGVDAISKGHIVIKDDVWIGYNSLILSGVEIGQGAVIAAGSVVTKDIPPYAIAAGVPARVIKYRFDKEIIAELLKIDYSKWNPAKLNKLKECLNTDITNENYKKLIGDILYGNNQ